MYYETAAFAFTRHLEAYWRRVRSELDQLSQGDFMAWPETGLYAHGWDVFGLFLAGHVLPPNARLCPQTVALLHAVPGLRTAGFSTLAPHAHIQPHCGTSSVVLRCHLGLQVPATGCALRVGDQTRAWAEGSCLVFDDTTEHEAWNKSDQPRTVLLLDFMRDPAAAPPEPAGWEALVLASL